jgi:hypothetical protein
MATPFATPFPPCLIYVLQKINLALILKFHRRHAKNTKNEISPIIILKINLFFLCFSGSSKKEQQIS